jgi:two-component system nitrogen regulation sensor histidine kinase NtrY
MTSDMAQGNTGARLRLPRVVVPRRSPLQRRLQALGTLVLVALAPILVMMTVAVLGPFGVTPNMPSLQLVLLADLIYVLVVAALIMARIARMIAARRSRATGSRLHLRLSALFAIISVLPAITVAVFATITINIGLEGWFSDRVRSVVSSSLAAADAYQQGQARDITQDGAAMADFLGRLYRSNPLMDDGQLRQFLTQAQAQVQRGLRVAFVVDSDGTIRARGERSYLFDFTPPPPEALARARTGATALIRDWPANEFRALVPIPGQADRLVYIARAVDGDLLGLLDETQETIQLYSQLERERGRVLFNFGLIYLGFALILVLAAIWLGIWFAEGLSRPIGRLAGAAESVGEGDLDVQVPEETGEDEIALLGRMFNQMTRQLKGQRAALLDTTDQIEARRRLFDSVLASVTAGVIGLDEAGRVAFVNRSACTLLETDEEAALGQRLDVMVPEFAPLFERLRNAEARPIGGRVQDEVRLSRGGRLESLLVRLAERRNQDRALEGYVVAFDDVTDLVSAQRLAAWGDVARRIAHEIKNPLTPIQLSAERIKRKFRAQVAEPDQLDQLTDVIVRQTGDLRRIVDEFSRFARMPEPDRRSHDLVAILRDAVTLQQAGQPDVRITAHLPDQPLVLDIDATMMSQAFTNLIKNAGEAIESLLEKGEVETPYQGRVEISLSRAADHVAITIADNGIGLPPDRARLFEPYVTTRAQGTGLGLPIVKKIIEEHGGALILRDAPVFDGATRAGALAEIRLPLLGAAPSQD